MDYEQSKIEYSFIFAAEHGNLHMVAKLLKEERLFPTLSGCGGCAINLAVKNGHHNVVYMLLNDERINPIRARHHREITINGYMYRGEICAGCLTNFITTS